MHIRAHICSKHYYVSEKSTAIRQFKRSVIIENYSISNICIYPCQSFSPVSQRQKSCTLAETLNNFECHRHQNYLCRENNLNKTLEALLFYLALLLVLLLLLVFIQISVVYESSNSRFADESLLFRLSLHEVYHA